MKKIRILSLMLCVCMLLGMMQIAAGALTPAVKSSGEADTPASYSVEIGSVRVQLLSDTLARVEVKGPEGYEDRETYHITGREWNGTSYSVSTSGDTEVITTENYSIYVPLNATALDGIYMTDNSGKVIWAYTSLPEESEYLPDPGDTPKAWAIADTPRVVPSEWGYAPLPEGETDNGYNGWNVTNDSPDMYIFVPMNDSKQLRSDFVALTGSTELVPLKALGLWHSRFYAYTEETALAQVEKYRDEGFPLDYFVVDTDWRVNASSGYEVNTNYFPNIQRFFERMNNEQNVNVVLSDHPEAVNGQQALSQADLKYRNENLSKFLNYGLNSWWFDRNWTVSIVSPFKGINKESFGMYLYYNITQRTKPETRALVLSNVDGIDNGSFNRAPDYASHRYSIQWTGDIGQTSSVLKQNIEDAVRSGAITSTPYVSADIGGHYGKQSDELFVRWSQYAAFSPIFRYHSVAGDYDRSPWLYGDEAENTARDYVNMRYRLMPLYYSLSHENYVDGMPMLRRLDYNYPQYAESQDDTEYTVGDNILVAPLYEGGKEQTIPASMISNGSEAGLKAEYFNNTNLTGAPVLTRSETDMTNDWGYGAPAQEVNSDNFSARWSGTVTAGDEKMRIAVKTDDGVRLWIDGTLVIDKWESINNVTNIASVMLDAHSTHDIKIEYYEGTGGARMNLIAITIPDEGDSREVFIPDGNWIDVWSGESYTGPQTITQTHGYSSSPIFVRSGTIIPLVDNVSYLGEKPWNEITLDVYPSTELDGESELYEDDTASTAYKNGEFRTTALSTTYDKSTGETVVSIGAASGSFSGDDAFDSRKWTVRVHAPEGWSDVTGATVDGKTVLPEMIDQDFEAAPFAISGGARDSEVYTVTFDKALTESSEVRIKFRSPGGEPVAPAPETIIDTEATQQTIPSSVDLDSIGTTDWAYFSSRNASSVIRKNVAGHVIGGLTVNGTTAVEEGNYAFTSEGNATASKYISTTGDSMEFDVKVSASEQRISLYAIGTASASLEITGGAGAKIVDIEPVDGAYAKRIVLDVSASAAATLHIKYKNTGESGYIALAAITVGSAAGEPDSSILRTVAYANAVSGTDISADVKDWVHLGLNNDTKAVNRKNGVSILPNPVFSGGSIFPVTDYPSLSFSGGTPTGSVSGSSSAVTCYGGTISLSAPSGASWQEFKVYMGAYQSTNTVEISDDNGNITRLSLSAGDATQRWVVTIKYYSAVDSTLHFSTSGTGHNFVAAYTLSDIDSGDLDEQYALASDALNKLEVSGSTTAADLLSAVSGALTDASVKAAWASPARVILPTSESDGSITGSIKISSGDIWLELKVNVTLPKSEVLPGDMDYDGKVTVSDVVALRKVIMSGNPTDKELSAGDLDGDKKLSVSDVVALRKLIMANG